MNTKQTKPTRKAIKTLVLASTLSLTVLVANPKPAAAFSINIPGLNISNPLDSIKGFVDRFIGSYVSYFENYLQTFIDFGMTAVQSTIDGVLENALGQVFQQVEAVAGPGAIMGALNLPDVNQLMANINKTILDGIEGFPLPTSVDADTATRQTMGEATVAIGRGVAEANLSQPSQERVRNVMLEAEKTITELQDDVIPGLAELAEEAAQADASQNVLKVIAAQMAVNGTVNAQMASVLETMRAESLMQFTMEQAQLPLLMAQMAETMTALANQSQLEQVGRGHMSFTQSNRVNGQMSVRVSENQVEE